MADEKDLKEKIADLNNTADTTSEYDPQDIEKNKIMAIVAYFSILVLIPLFAAKESRFARFHCNQGLILLILSIVIWIVQKILFILPSFIFFILRLAVLALAIIGIVNAYNGKAKELPVIGGIKILQ